MSKGQKAVFFSEDGNILSFFGETIYFAKDTVRTILGYPLDAANFCLDFLPTSASVFVRNFCTAVVGSGAELLSAVSDALDTFFKIGTRL